MKATKRSKVIDTTYRGCPECTYPLRKSIGVEGFGAPFFEKPFLRRKIYVS